MTLEKDTVRRNTKSCEPRNPPKIVIILPEPRSILNICIPANKINVRIDDTKNDAVVGRAVKRKFSMIAHIIYTKYRHTLKLTTTQFRDQLCYSC